MYKILPSNAFRKELKTMIKRGCDVSLLNDVVTILAKGEQLPERYRDHALIGNFSGYRECHIKPDWLLIYQTVDEDLFLYLVRTGTHSDLF